jgi:HSP20 family protein
MALTDLIPWPRGRSLETSFGDEHDPFTALQRDMNRLFDEFTRGFGMPSPNRPTWSTSWPHVDVSETPTEVTVTAELPGLEDKDVEVSLHDGRLTIKGEKTTQTEGSVYSERWQGKFRRSIQLGADVDPDKVTAGFRKGVLTVTCAKRPEAQTQVKKIPISGS